jgi:UPF0755 protein
MPGRQQLSLRITYECIMPKLRQTHEVGDPVLYRMRRRKLRTALLATIIPLVVVAIVGVGAAWYAWALRPLDATNANHIRVTIASGTTAPHIAQQLASVHLIRNATAFEIYARTSGNENKLQAGTYAFAPNESVNQIVSHLTSGKTDEFAITILPGATLRDIKTMLEGHGYGASEIDAALAASYSKSIVMARGSQTSLEGLLYPDTYSVLSDESLQTIFARIFDNYATVASANNLTAGFAAHGLSLYQGITLASIVQKEVATADDQRKVASVFYNRLDADMYLGSDVTFLYGASLLGVKPSPKLNSPYNTYVVKGLPPTPIATPGLSALQAVANPAQTGYLYFVAGDDGKTYFASTSAEHDANVKAYCKIKCQ